MDGKNGMVENKARKEFFRKLKKMLIYAAIGIGGFCVLALVLRIVEFLFVALLLIVGWLFPKRRR